jgi:branched-subunit amino acid aminotransferase/4-amino-4-deoxychorismate lyase
MESPYDQQQISDAIVELIKRNGFKACYIRPLVYRGYDSLGVNPFPCPVDVAIMLWEWGAYFTKDAIEKGSTSRFPPGPATPRTRCRRWPRAWPTTPTRS